MVRGYLLLRPPVNAGIFPAYKPGPLSGNVLGETMADIATSHSAGAVRRNVYVFGAVSFFNDTASEMAYWILPAFLASLGAGPAALGLIEGVAESVASLGKLFSGYLTDAVERRKPIIVFGYLLADLVKPFLALSTRWWQVLFIRFADRTAKGVRATPRDVMLAESVQKKKIGRTYGLLQAMDSAGAIAGPLIAWLVIARTGNMRWVFWLAAIPGVIAILVVLLARETRVRRASHEPAPSLLAPARLSGRFYYILGAVLIFSLGNSSDMFLVLRAQQIGISPRMAPLLGLVFNLTYTLGSWPAGWLSDRRSQEGHRGSRVPRLQRHLFHLRQGAKPRCHLDGDGRVRALLRAYQSGAARAGGGNCPARIARARVWHVLFLHQHRGSALQRRYWTVMEPPWRGASVLSVSGAGDCRRP